MNKGMFFGIFLFLTGLTSLVLNLIVYFKIEKTCKNDDLIKKSNNGNLILSGTVLLTGVILFFYSKSNNSVTNSFKFGG